MEQGLASRLKVARQETERLFRPVLLLVSDFTLMLHKEPVFMHRPVHNTGCYVKEAGLEQGLPQSAGQQVQEQPL
jgi:hypothetical protein